MVLKTLKSGILETRRWAVFLQGSTSRRWRRARHPPFYDALARWPSKWCVRRVRVAFKRAMSILSRRLWRLDSRRVRLPRAVQRECFSARDPNRCVLVSFRLRRACKPSGARYVELDCLLQIVSLSSFRPLVVGGAGRGAEDGAMTRCREDSLGSTA